MDTVGVTVGWRSHIDELVPRTCSTPLEGASVYSENVVVSLNKKSYTSAQSHYHLPYHCARPISFPEPLWLKEEFTPALGATTGIQSSALGPALWA